MDKKKEKDFIVGDVHGSAEYFKAIQDNVGYETSRKTTVNVGSPAENVPRGKVDLPSIIEVIRNNMEQSQINNDAHHSAQYEKMHPKKLK